MAQKSEALTREDNGISLVSRTRAATQEDYLIITEREMPLSTTKQTGRLKLEEETGVSRATPKSGSFLVDIIRWLYYLGSRKIDDRLPESRQKTHHDPHNKSF